jgi:hypothetical protein
MSGTLGYSRRTGGRLREPVHVWTRNRSGPSGKMHLIDYWRHHAESAKSQDQKMGEQLRNRIVLLIVAGLFLGSMGSAAAIPPEKVKYTSCEGLLAKYPYGVAKTSVAAITAARRGYSKPAVNAGVYVANVRLDKGKSGIACFTKTNAKQEASGRKLADVIASSYPPAIRSEIASIAPGSPAAAYLSYLAEFQDASDWYDYGSRGVVAPPSRAEPVTKVPSMGGAVKYRIGTDVAGEYTFAFDSVGRVTTWTTPAGPLENRITPISGEASSAGVSVRALSLYLTNLGAVAMTASVTNSTGREVLVNAVYDGGQGRLPAKTSGACVKAGQTAPLMAVTEVPSTAVVPSTWEIRLAADTGYCNVYSLETILNLPITRK